MTEHSREELLYLAKLAETAERYDEMIEFVSKFAKMGEDLQTEERNILSVAYKNVVGSRRAAWRVLSSIEQKETNKDNAQNVERVKGYKVKVEEELLKLCNEILSLLDDTLIPKAGNAEAKVFYYKMKGDYFRYISEFASSDPKKEAADKALEAYKQAYEVAQSDLAATHPIRLGLALNFSVFYYEIMQEPQKACEMAKSAFDEAISQLDQVPEGDYKDATLIMQLLRDNLTLWTSDQQEDA
mmetsp:Transcript_26421/g.30314  ORF Transcript_26421/g.30314 Transcript_26421/m.30314 type:complete len:242 (-) Transcript_26421:798-1523(-)